MPLCRKEHLIVMASGKMFQTWGSNKLGLLSVSKVHPRDITALATDSFLQRGVGSIIKVQTFLLPSPSQSPFPPSTPLLPHPSLSSFPRGVRGSDFRLILIVLKGAIRALAHPYRAFKGRIFGRFQVFCECAIRALVHP